MADVFTKDFLNKIFKNYDPNYELIDVKFEASQEIHLASDVKFLSTKYKYGNNFEEKTGAYVIKVPPSSSGIKKDLTDGSYAFENEMKMYGEILPKMQNILKKANLQLSIPKLIYQTNDPITMMIFEDVRLHGYESPFLMISSFDEMKLVITQLARFHASSYFLCNKNGEDLALFNKTFYYVGSREMIDKFIGINFRFVSEFAKEWKDEPEICEKMEILKDTYLEKLRKVCKPNKEGRGYNVLNHADFHFKNLMFKRNAEGKLDDIMLIDFQACQFASPAIDVINMTNAIAPLDKGLEWQNEAILFYYKEFISTLNRIGYTDLIPTLLDLQIELLKNGFYDVVLRVSFTHFAFIDLTKITEISDMFGRNTHPLGMERVEYREAIKKFLKNFNYKGLLD